MNNVAILGCAVALVLATAWPAVAGQGTTTGRDPQTWVEDRYTVIVARVRSVTELDRRRDAGTHAVALEPMATLAGVLDPGASSKMSARFYARGYGTNIKSAPRVDDIILAVVQLPKKAGEDAFIVSDICTFMPDEAGLVVVSGFDDRRVAATAARLREARTSPATAPAKTQPKPGG